MKIKYKIKFNKYSKQSIKYHLNQIQNKEIRELALFNFDNNFSDLSVSTQHKALQYAFDWNKSSQGWSFWDEIFRNLRDKKL